MLASSIGAPRQIWIESEQQLFSMSAMDPDRYEQVVKAIRAMSDHLSKFKTIESLEAAWADAETHYTDAAQAAGFEPESLPYAKVAGAAFAMADRNISVEIQKDRFTSAIADARNAGKDWVILGETGDLRHGLLDPYGCTEMDLASGLAIVTITQPEPSGAGVLHALSVVKLDRETGDLVDAEPGVSDWVDYSNIEELETARNSLREQIRPYKA